MTKTMIACGSVLSLTIGLAACNVHDNTVNRPNASLEVSTTGRRARTSRPAQSVPMTMMTARERLPRRAGARRRLPSTSLTPVTSSFTSTTSRRRPCS